MFVQVIAYFIFGRAKRTPTPASDINSNPTVSNASRITSFVACQITYPPCLDTSNGRGGDVRLFCEISNTTSQRNACHSMLSSPQIDGPAISSLNGWSYCGRSIPI